MSPIRENMPATDPAAPQKGRTIGSTVPADRCALSSDELVRARLFCIQAGAEIEAITIDRAVRDLRDPAQLSEQLTLIQREAKRARARGIYRSAQDVLKVLQASETPDWARVDARLFVLTRLVEQYESGLEDVERQMLETPQATPIQSPAIETEAVAAFGTARETLTGLLPHASDAERSALERLMDVARDPVVDAPKSDDPFALADAELLLPVEAEDETSTLVLTAEMEMETESDAVPADAAAPLVSLDTILPDLVQRLLGVAHQFGKIASVSHAVDSVRIPEDRLPGLQAELYEVLSAKIASDMPLQGVGHLDIAAGDGTLEITGSGFLPFALPLDAKDGAAPDAPAPAGWRPMITDDTEAQLRAQLSALLDGGL